MILIVDDNALMRKALTETLRFLGYVTREAADGADALHILETPGHGVRLMICDLSMPVMGGKELFLEMNRRDIGIPFVLLSGYLSREELQAFIDLGIAGWLHKPADLAEITALMNKLLS